MRGRNAMLAVVLVACWCSFPAKRVVEGRPAPGRLESLHSP